MIAKNKANIIYDLILEINNLVMNKYGISKQYMLYFNYGSGIMWVSGGFQSEIEDDYNFLKQLINKD